MNDDTMLAGVVGAPLAASLADKVAQVIDHFPDSTPPQRAAIARLICDRLRERYGSSPAAAVEPEALAAGRMVSRLTNREL